MNLVQIIKSGINNMIHNKLRSLLTMLGLVIGVSSVIILVGISEGSNQKVNEKVKSLGTDILTISLYTEKGIEYNKLDEIEKLGGIKSLAPNKMISKEVSKAGKKVNTAMITATNDQYISIKNMKLAVGRNLSFIDIENKSKVCVIGNKVAKELFGDATQALGNYIKVDGEEYVVVGVLEPQGENMGISSDTIVLIPLTTVQYLGADQNVSSFFAKVEDETKIEKTKQSIENYLITKQNIKKNMINVNSQDAMLNTSNEISSTLSLLLAGVAGISLIVGGIGVMNVMLVSVTERTKEIGIRKALGARKSDILVQFLIEALILSSLGGIFGIGFGVLFGMLASNVGYTFILSTDIIFLSVGASTTIGLIFGIFPAYRAGKLNPIDALRTE